MVDARRKHRLQQSPPPPRLWPAYATKQRVSMGANGFRDVECFDDAPALLAYLQQAVVKMTVLSHRAPQARWRSRCRWNSSFPRRASASSAERDLIPQAYNRQRETARSAAG